MSPALVLPILLSICLLLSACWGNGDLTAAHDLGPDAKPASKTTKAHNRQISQQLPFEDRTDFELAQ